MTKHFFFWPALLIFQLLAVALISWHLLALVDFLYPVAYRVLGIEQTIAKNAPTNQFRQNFGATSKQEHFRLFGEIVDAIQADGKGLEQITYPSKSGQADASMSSITLLRDAEIVHLKDVARVIDVFYVVGISGGVAWTLLAFYAYRQKMKLPASRSILLGFLTVLGLSAAVVFLIGPQTVFYWLHTVVFPEGHQWFFYYHESLMTMLMKAPDIFAFIGLWLLAVAIGLWFIALYGMRRVLERRSFAR